MAYVRVVEIMTKRPVMITTDETLLDAAKTMEKFRVSSLVVLDAQKNLAGIVTVDDLVRLGIAQQRDLSTPVSEFMTTDVITLEPDSDIRSVMGMFNEYDIRQAPVVEKKKVIGYVTMKDMLRYEPTLLELAVDNLRSEEDRRQKFIDSLSLEEMPDEDFFHY